MNGLETDMVPVGVRGASIGRGEEGAEFGGVFVGDIAAAAKASGLQESLRLQASLQYKIELLGVRICFSHMAQYCKKLAAMSWLPMVEFSGMVALRGEPAGADLLLNEVLRADRFRGLLTSPEGEVGEVGEVGEGLDSFMESGESLTWASCQLLYFLQIPAKMVKVVGRGRCASASCSAQGNCAAELDRFASFSNWISACESHRKISRRKIGRRLIT